MLKHNLKIAFRNIKKDKGTFLINLIGLSTGLACTMLIYLWVMSEKGVDQFHKNSGDLHQVLQNIKINDNDILTWEWTQGLLAKALKDELPEVELSASVIPLGGTGIISTGENSFKANDQFVSEGFFDVFTFPLLHGNKDDVLKDKNSVVLSESLALKLFNTTENLIGKTIDWQRNEETLDGEYLITGIAKNCPKESTMQFDLLFFYPRYFDMKPEIMDWGNSEPYTFVVLKEGTNILNFDQKIQNFLAQKTDNPEGTLFTQKYADRYLFGKYENGVLVGGRILYVRLFSLIAFFILLIACINFMNLSTAKATRRMKEVGVKKTIGADRKTLIAQYLSESILITSISVLTALLFVNFILPQFNEITGKELSLILNVNVLLSILAITLGTGIIAGSYPALYLSGFKPVNILKGKLNQSFGEIWARKGLVVFQFTMSLILIVAVMVVFQQIQFIQSKNLGYEKDNIVVIQKEGSLKAQTQMTTFLSEVKNISSVVNASTIDGDMMDDYGYTSGIHFEGENLDNPIRFSVMIAGVDIVETLGLEIKEGRGFSTEFGNDVGKYIFNEAAIKAMGMENPIGKKVQRNRRDREIIGVVKDFHFESLYEKIKPCVLRLGNYGDNILVKIQAGKEQETLAQLETVYKKFNTELPFEYKFLDENYQALYAAEHRVATLSKYFALMAILISCLGLFGLAAFTAQRRMKEISIRKVLGASVFSIISLLSSDFIKMVLVALAIGLPISYFVARQWLDSFAFRIELSIWSFAIAGSILLFVAWLTVGFQTAKAANVNPVNNLKE
ncbi:MAG: ABC transporter permease [Saprospiraceae bacterium]